MRQVTIPVGESVLLQTATTPAPTGGQVVIRLDYEDPLAGWVFRKLWEVTPEASVTFTPPSVGPWRVIASFRGDATLEPESFRIHDDRGDLRPECSGIMA